MRAMRKYRLVFVSNLCYDNDVDWAESVQSIISEEEKKKMSNIRGIDVSRYDPYIDWQTVRNQDIRFAIIKSTEGVGYFSERFNEQWAGAKSVGILRGSYHYLRADQDGAKQADWFLSHVDVQDGDLPPFLDIEGANNYIDPPKNTKLFSNSQFIGNAQNGSSVWRQKRAASPSFTPPRLFCRKS